MALRVSIPVRPFPLDGLHCTRLLSPANSEIHPSAHHGRPERSNPVHRSHPGTRTPSDEQASAAGGGGEGLPKKRTP